MKGQNKREPCPTPDFPDQNTGVEYKGRKKQKSRMRVAHAYGLDSCDKFPFS